MALRLFAIFSTNYIGKSTNMVLWTTAASSIFISYFVSGMMNVYVVVVSTDLNARVISVLLILGEVILNCLSLLCAMIIAYHILSKNTYNIFI